MRLCAIWLGFSHGYMYGGSAYPLIDEPYPADIQQAARAGTLAPTVLNEIYTELS